MIPDDLSAEATAALQTCRTFLACLKSKDHNLFTSLLHPSGQICNARYASPNQGSLLFHDFKTGLLGFLEDVFSGASVFEDVDQDAIRWCWLMGISLLFGRRIDFGLMVC